MSLSLGLRQENCDRNLNFATLQFAAALATYPRLLPSNAMLEVLIWSFMIAEAWMWLSRQCCV
jgi:hypothetical protein